VTSRAWRMKLLPLVLCLSLLSLHGCFFARVSTKNAGILFRTPDEIANRIVDPRRPEARLAALWIGHATVLLQLDDRFVLTDPVFTNFVGTVSKRLVAPGLAPENLPPVDALLISHRHYDHLSPDSIERIRSRISNVLVPEATTDDIPAGSYATTELPWWKSWEHDGLRITAVPVVHVGSRALDGASHPRSFTGYVIEYHDMVVYFGGDSAYRQDVFEDIAKRWPHIDLALLPIGPISPPAEMLPTHMNPAQALRSAHDLRAERMIPIHFDTFINSYDERGDCLRALEAAKNADAQSTLQVLPLHIGEQRVLIGPTSPQRRATR